MWYSLRVYAQPVTRRRFHVGGLKTFEAPLVTCRLVMGGAEVIPMGNEVQQKNKARIDACRDEYVRVEALYKVGIRRWEDYPGCLSFACS